MKHISTKALCLVLLAAFALSLPGAIPATERAALITLYNSTYGDHWTNKTGWKTPPLAADGFAKPGTEGTWYGVTVAAGHVAILNLHDNNVTQWLPSEIGDLTYLTTLDLSYNTFGGPIPIQVGNLSRLQVLNLRGNDFSGTIPPEICNMANLLTLDLSYNYLIGPIPAQIGNLTSLQHLNLHDIEFRGTIPPEIGKLTNLIDLDLSLDFLTGPIPTEIGNLTHLQTLDLSDNYFKTIPDSIGNLASLQTLYVRGNDLTAIPDSIGDLKSLQTLDLYWNNITAIPASIGGLTALQTLDLHSNELASPIPPEIGNLASLRVLDLNYNHLTGAIPDSIGNLASLQELLLFENQLSGAIPASIGNLRNLVKCRLYKNQLSGAIPAEIGNLANLKELNLYDNRITAIPASIGNLTGLQDLNLGINQITGAIPVQIGNMTGLQDLSLNVNLLTGNIPSQIGNLKNLLNLSLYNNQLTGPIPPQIFNLTKLTGIGLDHNQLTGTIPSQLGNLTKLTYLGFSHNQLTGAIPAQIGNLINLGHLDLSANRLTGAIPFQIGNLTRLHALYLDANGLSGAIPASIVNLAHLNPCDGYGDCWYETDIGYNALYSNDAGATDFLNGNDPDWADTQTVAPTNVHAAAAVDSAINLTWNAISYIGDPGGYRIYVGTTSGGPYTFFQQTADKTVTSLPVTGLNSATRYYFVIRARTDAHGGQQNIVESGNSAEVSCVTIPGSIVVTSPAAGELWERGQAHSIAWSTQGTLNANVKIQLFQGTTLLSTIAGTTPNDGSYEWTIPARQATGTNYKVRVITVDGLVKGDSGKFSITAPTIRITAPTSGMVWVKETTKTISWNKAGTQDANVKIQLFKDTIKKLDITLSAPNSGSFDWAIPATLINGTYTIRITTLDGKVKGTSKGFAIARGMIRVTAPTLGTSWQRGVAHTITWTGEGTLNANVKIQLFKGTTLVSTIVSTTPNDGSFDWTIPAAQAPATTYKIRVTTVDNLVQANSGAFTISSSVGLRLTAPNGGEILQASEPFVIRWTDDPNVLEVKLEFSRDNGGTYMTIADYVEDTGKYEWLAPVNFTRNGIVRVSDASGKPWLNDGLLEFSFKFNYTGEGDEPGTALWFGGSDPRDPGFGFAKIGIGRTQIQFGGFTKAIDPLAGNWHELRVRFDFRRDTAAIKLDDQVLFENAPLNTTREHYFQPNLALQAGGNNGLEFMMDDLDINIVQLDIQGNEKGVFNALNDDFDRYDDRSNPLQNCWQGLNAIDKANKIELNVDSPIGKSLRLRTEAGKQVLIFLPFSLPDKVPFDISDKCFNIEN